MASEDERDPIGSWGGGAGAAGGDVPIEVRAPDELTILFVDDERQLLSILASRLKDEMGDMEAVTAKNGTEALERIDQMEIDCVVSDYKMPGMDGLELLRQCRERDPDIPFILFTSKGSEEVATEAINADVTDYLQKDMGEEQFALLANRIENAVSEYRAKRVAHDTYQHVRRIHDRVSDAYLGLDEDWHVTYIDEAGADLLNDSRESLLGESLWEALPEAVGSPFQTQFERALASGEPVDFETRYEPFDTWFEVRAFPSDDGLSVYFRDITDLKEQAAEIERHRKRLSSLADAIADLHNVAGAIEDGVERAHEQCNCEDTSLDHVADAVADLEDAIDEIEDAANR